MALFEDGGDAHAEAGAPGMRRRLQEGAPLVAEEEADGGNAGGSSLDAGCGVFFGDAAEGEDGHGLRLLDGSAQGGDALAARHSLAGYFFKDGREEQQGGAGGLADFLGRVAGGADDELAAGAGVDLFRGLDGGGACVGVQVHAVGSGIEGQLRGAVDQDLSPAGRAIWRRARLRQCAQRAAAARREADPFRGPG